jgi:hypothetical protein
MTAKGKTKVETKLKETKKKYVIPRKLTLGFMAKTFFVTLVDPSIGSEEVKTTSKEESKGKKITGDRLVRKLR